MGYKRQGTKTSSFGVSNRINHDSSEFYAKRMYGNNNAKKKVKYCENPIEENVVDIVHCADSRDMRKLPEYSVHLMVTSPPYNAAKEYDEDLSLEEYLQLLKDVFVEVYRVLVPGGRACVNIANLGRKPYIPLHSYIIKDMIDIGYLMRGEIIWYKGTPGGSCAWGSWQSAANPTLRDTHEYIMVFSKDTYSRPKGNRNNTISRNEFLEYTQSMWEFPPESAKKVGHPAPFPEELPYRLIQLYTFEGDVVLDPFCGSGTSCIAALKSGRRYVGFDTVQEYVDLSKKRIEQARAKLQVKKLSDFASITTKSKTTV